LPASFYLQADVLKIAEGLLGKILQTKINGVITAGRIVEVEAYNGIADRASHAAGGRRTARNEIMYGAGGYAYIYLCYGIHHLFNVVTNTADIPHAVLIRALEPLEGIGEMMKRRGRSKPGYFLTRGPGNLSKALGITTAYTGMKLSGEVISILEDGFCFHPDDITRSPRIGVDYAGEDAKLPYRFFIKNNLYVSGKNTGAV